MSLPRPIRFSIRGLLIVMGLAACGSFWVTWPKRTAKGFVVEYFRQLDADVNPFKPGTPEASTFAANYRSPKRDLALLAHKRSWMDLIAGRQTFDCQMHEFTVCRGEIVSGPKPFFQSVARFYR